MATAVDICNIALSYLGDRATVTSIDPPEGSAQADHCARFYPIAVKSLLASFNWSFAITRKVLSPFTTRPLGGGYAFGLPADLVTLIEVKTYDVVEDEDQTSTKAKAKEQFQTSPVHVHYTRELYNNQDALITEYPRVWIKYVTSEVPARNFPNLFADALAYLLASKLAGVLMPGSSGAQMSQAMLKIFQQVEERARHADAVQDKKHFSFKPDFLGDFSMIEDDGHGIN